MPKSEATPSGYARRFGTAFQRHALAVILRVPGVAIEYRPVLDPAFFSAEELNVVAEHALAHIDKYRTCPSRSTLIETMRPLVAEKLFPTIEKEVKRLYKDDVSDFKAVVDNLSDFGRQRAVENAVIESAADINRGKIDGIVSRMQQAVSVGKLLGSDVINYGSATIEDRRKWYDDNNEIVPTGMPLLDKVLGGGGRRGELMAILGAAKRGKTTAAVNVGFGGATMGMNVLHLSCELGRSYVARRYDARLAGIKSRLLKEHPERYMKLVTDRQQRLIAGSLAIMSFPTRTLAPSQVRMILDQRRALGFPVDMLIVDYADLMRPERRLDEKKHDQIAGLWEDCRTIAGEYNLLAVTPSQTKQIAFNKDVVDLSDFAEAYEKAAVIDIGIAVCQTEEEQVHNECRIAHVASRNSGSGSVIKCEIHRDRCLIRDIEIMDPSVALKQGKKQRGKKERFSKKVDE